MSESDRPAANAEEEQILRSDQLRCLVSATRMDIVDHLAGRGALSIKELATAIGKQPSALYHHLEKLLDVGLVREAGTRIVNRRQEKLYATLSRRMRLVHALESGEHDEVMTKVVGALSRQADRDFMRGLANPVAKAGGEGRNLGFFRLVTKPSPEKLASINEKLLEIAELMWEEDDEESQGDAMVLTWVMAPGS